MNSEQQVSILLEAVDCFNDARRRDECFKLYAPDARFHGLPPGFPPTIAGARSAYAQIWAGTSGGRLVLDEITAHRNVIISRYRLSIDDAPVRAGWAAFRFADGLCVEHRMHLDETGARQMIARA